MFVHPIYAAFRSFNNRKVTLPLSLASKQFTHNDAAKIFGNRSSERHRIRLTLMITERIKENWENSVSNYLYSLNILLGTRRSPI